MAVAGRPHKGVQLPKGEWVILEVQQGNLHWYDLAYQVEPPPMADIGRVIPAMTPALIHRHDPYYTLGGARRARDKLIWELGSHSRTERIVP